MKKIFFSQLIPDSPIDERKIGLEGSVLPLLSDDPQAFELESACPVIGTADGSRDPHGLVGRTLDRDGMTRPGAEMHLALDSILNGDFAQWRTKGSYGTPFRGRPTCAIPRGEPFLTA